MESYSCIDRMSLKERAVQDSENHGYTIKASSLNNYSVVEPHPSQLRALPNPALFEHSPIVLTGDPRVTSQALAGSYDPTKPVPVNQEITLDSDMFIGCIYALVRDLPGAPKGAFAGTKWLTSTIIQGRFKRPTPAADLWLGQELWNKPLLPVSFQRLVYSTAAKFFSNTSRIATEGECVGFLNPLLAMAQVVNVSKPGCQPDPLQAQEDMRLFGRSLVDHKGQPMAAAQRQKYFDKPSNLAAATFDDTNIYTFVIGQTILDLPKYKLSLGGFLTLDLCSILNGQPLQMMCKNLRGRVVSDPQLGLLMDRLMEWCCRCLSLILQDNSTVISLLVWHKRLNYQQGIPARHGSPDSRTSSCCGGEGSSIGGHSRSSSTDCSSSSSSSPGGDITSSSISRCASSDSRIVDGCSSSSSSRSEADEHPDDESCCSSMYGSARSWFSSECGSLAGDLSTCLAELDAVAEQHAGPSTSDAGSSRSDPLRSRIRVGRLKGSGVKDANSCGPSGRDTPVFVDIGLQKLPGSAASKLAAGLKGMSSKAGLRKLLGKSKKDRCS